MDYYVITLNMGYQFVFGKAIYEYSDVSYRNSPEGAKGKLFV